MLAMTHSPWCLSSHSGAGWLVWLAPLLLACSSAPPQQSSSTGGTIVQAGQSSTLSTGDGGSTASGPNAAGGQTHLPSGGGIGQTRTAGGGVGATSSMDAGGANVGAGTGALSSGGTSVRTTSTGGTANNTTAIGGSSTTRGGNGGASIANVGGTSVAGRNNGGTTAGGTTAGGRTSGGASGAGQGSGGQNVAGASPGVRIVGRTAAGTRGGTRFQWSGVSIQARFRGTQVSVQLDDGNNQNEFTIVIDGNVLNNVVTSSGKTSYQLASGLTNADHDLLIWRRTEAYYNPTEFLGLTDFGANGALLAAPPAPDRRIEIIGDSITCGYGNEGTPGCTGTKPENNYLAYGSVAARALGADLHTVAWSGIGMYRNYDQSGPSADAMPARYDSALPTVTGSSWDFARYSPQAVVINLGTNDFSTRGDPGKPYVDAYVQFVKHVRSVYPQAFIICIVAVTEATADINQVISTIKNAGDSQIEALDISVSSGGDGCDGHPNVAKHNAMGAKLAAEIRRVLNW